MYHYIRNLPATKYPRLKGMLLDDFNAQIKVLAQKYEMATLESAMEFIAGTYRPSRSLCLLTFDDGFKEHYQDVAPLLAEQKIQGIFFLITNCIEERKVASVHMNHFLMASLELPIYRQELTEYMHLSGEDEILRRVDPQKAARTYPWDSFEVAVFKYFFNFVVSLKERDRAIKRIFERHLGSEANFSGELYVSWKEAREMQSMGMIIGGHSHRHEPLSSLRKLELRLDLERCRCLLDKHLLSQPDWPFSYPYGKCDSFTERTMEELKLLSFDCSFSTEAGSNLPNCNPFSLRRIDCKLAPPF
jgi:peptidoglycan/xylan/chitin deacetylase (PgdA/CDA1 family)